MKKLMILLLIVVPISLVQVGHDVSADEPIGYLWNNHSSPFDFLFGNMIDTHQQSKLGPQGDLHGFLYIHYTGEFTADGYPIARKANCPIESCNVGWILKGTPITARLLQKGPRIWLVDPADLPNQEGYSHFQWVGSPGSPHALEVGQVYSGILLRRVAPAPFFWLGGSDGGGGSGGGHDGHGGHDDSGSNGRLVWEGIDPHSNIVTDPADIGHGGHGDDDGHGGDDGGCGGCSGH